jgi:hypothetical protein
LIPKPETKAAGRGQGKITWYQDSAPAEGYASGCLMRLSGIAHEPIAKARKKALAAESEINGPVVEYIKAVQTLIDGVPDSLWYEWLHLKLEAQDPSGDSSKIFREKANSIWNARIAAQGLINLGIVVTDDHIEKLAMRMGEDKERFKEIVKAILEEVTKK